MLSLFTMAVIASFVLMTWFETPSEPPVRHDTFGNDENHSSDEDDVRAA